MSQGKTFIIDFDSTFIQVESLDILAEIALKGHPRKVQLVAEIAELTKKSMNGELKFSETLKQRLELLIISKSHVKKTIEILKNKVTHSIQRHSQFFKDYASQVYIISGGFRDIVWPIVEPFGVESSKVFGNEFFYDFNGRVVGFNLDNVLAQPEGKAKLVENLELPGELVALGDGYNDYQMKKHGVINKFVAFVENVTRPNVVEIADSTAKDFGKFLENNQIPVKKHKKQAKILLLENIHPNAVSLFLQQGLEVIRHEKSLTEQQLIEELQGVSFLGIRSKTKITPAIIDAAPDLLAIGAFCIGTNQIDLDYCTKCAVAVFNAPFSNTRSVVELAVAEIIILARGILDKNTALHQGKWQKSASGSYEVRGKKIGIIGYGNIGSQLSVLAENLGMVVYYYDIVEKLPLGNARKCHSLKQLLSKVDFVTVHVDGREENHQLINGEAFEWMQEGAIFLNLSRGHVVDLDALAKAIECGKIRGAAIDVFPEEPSSKQECLKTPLQHLNNMLLTPHVGGSTQEAQRNIGHFVAEKIIDYYCYGTSQMSINFPNLQLPDLQSFHRIIHIHRNVPGILAEINQLLAQYEINIEGQYLKTEEALGYVITDVSSAIDDNLFTALQQVSETLRLRVLC